MKKIIIMLMLVLLTNCATTKEVNTVSLGMTKAEVLRIMGTPRGVSAIEGVEYLEYHLWRGYGVGSEWAEAPRWERNFWDPVEIFFVRLKEGKVDAYGKKGDFDFTKVPETKETIDLNIKTQ
jgi:hypothetical protein